MDGSRDESCCWMSKAGGEWCPLNIADKRPVDVKLQSFLNRVRLQVALKSSKKVEKGGARIATALAVDPHPSRESRAAEVSKAIVGTIDLGASLRSCRGGGSRSLRDRDVAGVIQVTRWRAMGIQSSRSPNITVLPSYWSFGRRLGSQRRHGPGYNRIRQQLRC